ncbi:hypothetical protein Goe24_02450 [Bacillus phage vB_BsuM-Goe24]|nr:hypothetical protein Goe7_c02430 [Bacillus phage vB_BveM-Goe7]WCS69620.1 hypothetical protein Goe24_02450 [Bacillus phage vB_BsuM-Goe24]
MKNIADVLEKLLEGRTAPDKTIFVRDTTGELVHVSEIGLDDNRDLIIQIEGQVKLAGENK